MGKTNNRKTVSAAQPFAEAAKRVAEKTTNGVDEEKKQVRPHEEPEEQREEATSDVSMTEGDGNDEFADGKDDDLDKFEKTTHTCPIKAVKRLHSGGKDKEINWNELVAMGGVLFTTLTIFVLVLFFYKLLWESFVYLDCINPSNLDESIARCGPPPFKAGPLWQMVGAISSGIIGLTIAIIIIQWEMHFRDERKRDQELARFLLKMKKENNGKKISPNPNTSNLCH